MEQAPAAVSVERVSKAFRLPHQRYSTLKERALHPFASSTYDVLQALDDVSFEVRAGEFFGIVGRNGSGKSTMLKCLAGIYSVDDGEIAVNGRLSPFIELGVGFNPELTARDNVLINAIMLGLTRKQARERFDEIIAFAELEEFVDLKLKNYSSGMSVRLGFSTAIQVDADMLLVDEVLAVGDAAFQAKCFGEFERLKREGRTILFVTHDMATVERFCDRAMLLERGEVVDIGPPRPIAQQYAELNFGRASAARAQASADGPAAVRVTRRMVRGRDGRAGRSPSTRARRAAPASTWSSTAPSTGPAVRDHLPQRRPPHDLRGHERATRAAGAASPPASARRSASSSRTGSPRRATRSRRRCPRESRRASSTACRRPRRADRRVGHGDRRRGGLPTDLEVDPRGERARHSRAHDASAARPRSATTCGASGASPTRSRPPTSSCASSAPRSATCGR